MDDSVRCWPTIRCSGAAHARHTLRIPDSSSAPTAASEWSGVSEMCDQSPSVVRPQLRASSAPSKFPSTHPPEVPRPEIVFDGDQVSTERPVGEDAACGGFPGMPMSVDEAGQRYRARAINFNGIGNHQTRTDGGDKAVLYQDVAVCHVTDVIVRRNYKTPSNYGA